MIDQENTFSTDIEQQLNLSILDIKNFANTAVSKYLDGIFELNPDIQFIYFLLDGDYDEETISVYLIESEFETIVDECFTEFKRSFGSRRTSKDFITINCQHPLSKEIHKFWYPVALHELYDGILPIPVENIISRLKYELRTPNKRETHHDDGLDILKQRAIEIKKLLDFTDTGYETFYHRSGKQYSGFSYAIGPTVKVKNFGIKKL